MQQSEPCDQEGVNKLLVVNPGVKPSLIQRKLTRGYMSGVTVPVVVSGAIVGVTTVIWTRNQSGVLGISVRIAITSLPAPITSERERDRLLAGNGARPDHIMIITSIQTDIRVYTLRPFWFHFSAIN